MNETALILLVESIKAGALKNAGSSLGVSLLAKDCLLAAQVIHGTAKLEGGLSFTKDGNVTRGRPRKPQVTPLPTAPSDPLPTPSQFVEGIIGQEAT